VYCFYMGTVQFTTAINVDRRSQPQPITRKQAETLFKDIFPTQKLEDFIQSVIPKDSLEYKGEVLLVPNKAVILYGQLEKQGTTLYNYDLYISAKSNTMYAAKLESVGENIYPSISRAVLRTLSKLCKNLGIEEFIINPGMEDGVYLWARMGILPTDQRECERLQKDYLLPKLEQYKSLIPREDCLHAIALVEALPDKLSSIQDIAKLNTKIEIDGTTQSLGRLLLRGTKWMATVPLNNKDTQSLTIEQEAKPTISIVENDDQNPVHAYLMQTLHRFRDIMR
ncbi:MAG: hypothetical protein AAFY76_25395, partial [Cyanobacteria bacterium J06649_11]